MRTATAFVLCSALLSAQTAGSLFNKAPAGVEEALRERVTQFFSMQSEGKFRAAEAFVCQDSKDAYYDAGKNRWTSVALTSITWEENFQKAKVLVALGTQLNTPSGSIPAKFPFNSPWKLEEGKWCYHIPAVTGKGMDSPFGRMMGGEKSKDGTTIPSTGSAPLTAEGFRQSLKISKTAVRLKSDAPSKDAVEIANGLPGTIRLEISAPDLPGLDLKLSATELKTGETVIFTADYKPKDKAKKYTFTANIIIQPFQGLIPIDVTFDPPSAPTQ